MTRTMLKSVLAVLVLGAATLAYAGEFGTAAEAKAMLEKATAALKADKAKALAQ